jgi:hypothetical protein
MIGSLTNDMIRLCGEISVLHENREVLRSNLALGREKLKDTVSQMQADLRHAHREMANTSKAELGDFVANVKDAVLQVTRKVAAFREDILGDMAGARRAWCGHLSGQTRFQTAAEEPPKAKEPPKVFSAKANKKKR